MVKPFKLCPVYKEIMWGGTELRKVFGKPIPTEKTAESWELCVHPEGVNAIENEDYSLEEAIAANPEILGTKVDKTDVFPLLFKLIDANDRLSVQVHPNDALAQEMDNLPCGKTECWYVIDAKPGAQLVYGLAEGTTYKQYEDSIKSGSLEQHLNFVDVKKGDFFFIKAGTVHAIGEGLLIAELQQNSNTTYRVFDWNRVDKNGMPRPLHVEKALRASNIDAKTNRGGGLTYSLKDADYTILSVCEYFALERIVIKRRHIRKTNPQTFNVLFFLEGCGKIKWQAGSLEYKAGDTVFMPANLGKYTISDKCVVLDMYVPDVTGMLLPRLYRAGYKREEVERELF